MAVKVDKSGIGSFRTPGRKSAWLKFACSIVFASALPTSLQAATYYWQEDSGTSVAGFTTDSTGCGFNEEDVLLTTLMSAGGFNCASKRHEGTTAVPQNLWLIINDTVYAVATDVTGIDFALNFVDDGSGGVTARYELGYAQAGVFTSWGFVDEGPHEPEALYVTDLSSISGTAPAGSHLALRIIDVAPSAGVMRMFLGSDDSSGVLNVVEIASTAFSARWPLDEISGVIAADLDSGNDGTYRNGVLLNQTAACTDTGNAVYFDGVDDFVEVPHSPDYLMDEGTVAFWANADAIGTQQGLFSKDSTGFDTGGHLTVLILPTGVVQVRLQSTTGDNFVNSARRSLPVPGSMWRSAGARQAWHFISMAQRR